MYDKKNWKLNDFVQKKDILHIYINIFLRSYHATLPLKELKNLDLCFPACAYWLKLQILLEQQQQHQQKHQLNPRHSCIDFIEIKH